MIPAQRLKFSPVILDPNTANGSLCLTEDLTSVSHTEIMQQLPDNPERFTMYPSVLGSEGFSSGSTHTWEVEVGDHPRWHIGYATQSVDRKGVRSDKHTEEGIWCLCRHNLKYSNGVKYFDLQRNPQRIRVQLDYDKGEVSFYDTEDTLKICTHRDTFTDKLYPYLNYMKADDAETIRICQLAHGSPTCGPVSRSCQRRVALLQCSPRSQTGPRFFETLNSTSSSPLRQPPRPARGWQCRNLFTACFSVMARRSGTLTVFPQMSERPTVF